ncbi:MAG TPA: glutamine--tRNA ligase/YqeY domain fusion protein [Thermoclostridium caenicola]|uniref:glutamine--tRNA ligase/YqeY domain fusion protein n=1 Tax=Thermoclostridium caenicola TaxID=659425 RepID=UPI002B784E1C|nr:glutamine--tRNA ligase/YqeY domain fusion protein [Thermoclostridium caenicola]HOK42301.1 glutamine--tRNA ligase/YqeY domain fusion protein [Thermoclostridium caenicola]HOL85527.1 glutamine--tRNA ligase/YqeY domain fusion protein [Thermoclostridium caenicola]HPO76787.1 glutamine--tRNA ligase/YqeY domain fusion protein [Thermoclostridium caenicola]
MEEMERRSKNFIEEIIEKDLESGRVKEIRTRFPPEPNGYLHIGHTKAMCVDFGVAEKYGGKCNLRFDDTNPTKEDVEYVDAIIEDIRWMGFDFGDRVYFGSDYSEQIYQYAVQLIKKGLAYVDDLSPEEMREYRGTLTEPGRESPYRNRSIEENLELFERMRKGEFESGEKTLRAKIDMASPNLNMRDPVIYRIKKEPHHRTGTQWCIYPMYDFAHPLQDAIEGITHSLCSIEYVDHRPLYDWFLEKLEIPNPPRQYEFARLNINYTVMSKRKLRELVEKGYVDGWDDPRMPTLRALRRRGFTPASIRNFIELNGISKTASVADWGLLEHCVREDLNKNADRVMAVLKPLKVVIENYPEDLVEEFDVENNPERPEKGTRKVPFSREIYIERDDFAIDPPPKYFRLKPGGEVRLKNAYFIKCTGYETDENGEVTLVRAVYDPASRGGESPDGRKVKGTIHWVSAKHAIDAEVRLYDKLFAVENPDDIPDGSDYKDYINPDSLIVIKGAKLEPCLKDAKPEEKFQFLRIGYFCVDNKDSKPGNLVFNRTVGLKDTWAKIASKQQAGNG